MGANISNHSNFFLELGSIVQAFEPSVANFELLVQNCKDAQCHRIALSNQEGTARLTTFPEAMGNSSLVASWEMLSSQYGTPVVQETVQTRTLDSFKVNRPTLIKIDVEGSELSVIQGAGKTLQKHKPALWVEIHKNPNRKGHESVTSGEGVRNHLRGLGYRTIKVLGVDYIFIHEQNLAVGDRVGGD